jgi:hypothetical protein
VTTPEFTPTPAPPSSAKLLKSTAIALAVAAVILVTIVLPAEYGVDPTGIGRVLGLKEMGEIKMRLAAEAETAAPAANTPAGASAITPTATSAPSAPASADTGRSDVTVSVIAPGAAREIKLVMRKDARAMFSWSTDRGVVNYDTHADAPGIRYHNYAKGTAIRADSGSLTAAFDGQHGWFWRNRGTDTVTVTLRTRGAYSDVKRVQ